MTIVVKIGGTALEDATILRKCARAIAELAQDGHRVAVVHGGGSALTRVLKSLLVGVSGFDPASIFAATLLMTLTALAAAFLPAQRAASIEPMEALRSE